MKIIFSFLYFIIILLFLNSCKKHEVSDTINDNLKIQKNTDDSLKKIEERNRGNEKKQNEELIKQENINSWIGKYEYSESAKELNGITSMVWIYKITIKRNTDSDLEASIYSEGYQTLPKTIRCIVRLDSNKIDLFSKSNNSLQLSLEKNINGKLLTYWKTFQPNIDKINGKVRFRKTN